MNLFQRLTNNLVLKVFSLLLAMLLMFYVLHSVNPTWNDEFQLGMKLENLDPELIVTDPVPMPAGPIIKVNGPINSVRRLKGVNLTAVLDCSTITIPGIYTMVVKPPDLGDVQITDQTFKLTQLKVEQKARATFQIGINQVGTIEADFEKDEEHISHDTVEVVGPKSLVDRIDVTLVEPLLKDQRDDIRNQVLPVHLYDKNYDLIEDEILQLQPAQVSYSLRLVSSEAIRVLRVVPMYSGQLPEEYSLVKHVIDPWTIPVDAELVPEGVFAVRTTPIDLTGASESFTAETKLIYPFEVPEDSLLPEDCEVQVNIIPIAEIGGATRVDVELFGSQESYDYIITPPEIVVRSEELLVLSADEIEQIRAAVFVEGLGPGEYRLSPQLFLPLTLERVTIDHDTLQLTIIQSGE